MSGVLSAIENTDLSFEEVKLPEERKTAVNHYNEMGLTKEKTNVIIRISNAVGVVIPGGKTKKNNLMSPKMKK